MAGKQSQDVASPSRRDGLAGSAATKSSQSMIT